MTLAHHHTGRGLPVVPDQPQTGNLVPAGAPGGPASTPQQQAQLLSSLEAGWPTGAVLAWTPTGSTPDPCHVLDGHRRLAVLACPQARTTAAQAWLDDQAPHLDANLAVLTITDTDRYHAT